LKRGRIVAPGISASACLLLAGVASASAPSVPGLPELPSLPQPPAAPAVPAVPALPAVPTAVSPPPASSMTPGASPVAVTDPASRALSIVALPWTAARTATTGSPNRVQGARRRRARAAQRREATFRRRVAGLEGCLYVLRPFEREVIAFRAGLRGSAPHSRAAAARHYRRSPGRIRGIERRSLRSLRSAAARTGCASAAVGRSTDWRLRHFGHVAPGSRLAAHVMGGAGGKASRRGRSVVRGVVQSGTEPRPRKHPPSFMGITSAPRTPVQWTVVIALLVVVASGIGFIAREFHKVLRG
jgi:hypothetical protein